jgi:DNA (cytosine-5)-methyltransferase 1|tara:strand:- start:61 stop:1038 length:978 start_codon:yes stop_codon:yes gene_type:complete
MSYTVGSLFAGIGGICLGFKQANYKILWANEIDQKACETYAFNFPDHKLYCEDIHSLKNPKKLGKVDIITSGFPCQAFSVAGYRKGFHDPRGNLFFETARFIKEIQPKAFLLENVKNLKGHDKGNTFKVIEQVITEDLGYSFIPFTLNAKDYGDTPQTRERIYMVGFKGESKSPKICTNNFKELEKIPLKKGIKDAINRSKQNEKYYYQKEHQYYPQLKKEIRSENTVYQWRRVYVRENKSNLCPTLTANMGTGGHNVPLIKDKYGIRKLTPSECAAFQGFPKEFQFPEDMANSHCYKQAGNSVVVPVIKRIAEEISRVLDIKNG